VQQIGAGTYVTLRSMNETCTSASRAQ